MPLYDCMLLVKPMVTKESMAELVARVARRAYQCNGVVTELKSFGKVHLGYGIRKLDGRHFQVRPDSPLFVYTFLVMPYCL
jgi:small subunit ribosomal protein S6